MKNLDYNTENLIQSFLKYGSKDTLSVDDFLKFRQQVVQESLMGIRDREIIEREEEINKKSIQKTNDNVISPSQTIINKPQIETKPIIHQSTINKVENSKENKQSTFNDEKGKEEQINIIEDEESDDSEEFNDKIFLEMMRSIED